MLLEHGVRFDLLAHGGGTLVNMEMQALATKGLNERALYYLSSLVLLSLDRGKHYESLGKSVVVFLCKFDPFNKGRTEYKFSLKADNPRGLKLTDKANVIFYNTLAWAKAKDKRRQALLRYIATGETVSELAGQLEGTVLAVKRNDKAKGGSTMLYETVMRGMAQSEKRGIAIGAYEKAVQTARNLLAMGLSPQQVAQGTGLALEEVVALS